MDNFIDNNILIFCPKCSRSINAISFKFNWLNTKQNLFFEYFCKDCYEYEQKQKKEKNKNYNSCINTNNKKGQENQSGPSNLNNQEKL